eukprot:Skav224307  [mRNA]  locus=scaffold227:53961:59865:- [translate_table: standard]
MEDIVLEDEEHPSATILRGLAVAVQTALHVHVTRLCATFAWFPLLVGPLPTDGRLNFRHSAGKFGVPAG